MADTRRQNKMDPPSCLAGGQVPSSQNYLHFVLQTHLCSLQPKGMFGRPDTFKKKKNFRFVGLQTSAAEFYRVEGGRDFS